MKATRLLSLAALACLMPAASATAAPRGRLVRRPAVACAAVEGIPAVSVSLDGGLTTLPHLEQEETFDLYTIGTDLILMDASGTILQRARLPYRNINAIAFSPLSPSVLYLGLRQSPMTATP